MGLKLCNLQVFVSKCNSEAVDVCPFPTSIGVQDTAALFAIYPPDLSGRMASSVKKQREGNAGVQLFLLFMQARTPAHRMVPPAFRVGLPTSAYSRNLFTDTPKVCLLVRSCE